MTVASSNQNSVPRQWSHPSWKNPLPRNASGSRCLRGRWRFGRGEEHLECAGRAKRRRCFGLRICAARLKLLKEGLLLSVSADAGEQIRRHQRMPVAVQWFLDPFHKQLAKLLPMKPLFRFAQKSRSNCRSQTDEEWLSHLLSDNQLLHR